MISFSYKYRHKRRYFSTKLIDINNTLKRRHEIIEIIEEFGKRVFHYRKSLGLTQEDLAGRADIEASKISNIEKGKYKEGLSLISLKNLANALGIPVCRLIGEEEDGIAKVSDDVRNQEDKFKTMERRRDPFELSENLIDFFHKIDGIELKNGEAIQILNFARFLVLQREEYSRELLKLSIKDLKQKREQQREQQKQ